MCLHAPSPSPWCLHVAGLLTSLLCLRGGLNEMAMQKPNASVSSGRWNTGGSELSSDICLSRFCGWKSRVKASADSVSSEDPLPGLQAATFLLRPHVAFLRACKGSGERDRQMGRDRESKLHLWCLSCEGHSPCLIRAPLYNLIEPIFFLPSKVATLGVRASTYESEGGRYTIQPIMWAY